MLFYDFEVFKKDWLIVVYDMLNEKKYYIINDKEKLQEFYEEHVNDIWLGYNSKHYDQYILKGILLDFNPYEISQFIIEQKKYGWEFSNSFNKINLYNYDIKIGFRSLKELEGFMGSDIKESNVPFNIQRKLTKEELKEVLHYCIHDVEQTIEVFLESKEEFDSHMSLLKAFDLSLKYINKTKAQLSAIILKSHKTNFKDEFDISFPTTLDIKKYKHIKSWYENPSNHNYEKELNCLIAETPHKFAWGGLHGAKLNYIKKGLFINVDVVSYYPALMIEYGFLSRGVTDPKKYEEIRDRRLVLKADKDPKQYPYKIVLNTTYGAMKNKWNKLYDPKQANNVCVTGQLLLLDLIEHLEPFSEIVQSNTDGVLVRVDSVALAAQVKLACEEWEKRVYMKLEYETYEKVYQKDVNNYIIINRLGEYKSKGAYVKKLSKLDNDLPIVNKALINYFIKGISPNDTINRCDNLLEFQKICKVTQKYEYATHGNKRLKEKIANTPDNCFIENKGITKINEKLDRKWYIELAKKRIKSFVGE